jgi:ubiquinone/menaquinone biosynthesis C-methylase UbiE
MSTIDTAIQQQFGQVAEQYRTSTVHATGADLDQIARLVRQIQAPHVLDAGCGAGHVTAAVAPWSASVTACDLTEEMLAQTLELARERGLSNVRIERANVERLPFADATFDVVVSRYSAHHWQRPLPALRECLRVLKPDGRLLLDDIVAPEEPALDTFLQTVEYLRDRSHVRDHSVSQWEEMFARAGVSAELVSSWDVPLEFVPWVTRMATPAPNVRMIRHIFDTAPDEVRRAFAIGGDYRWTIQGALFSATRRAEKG